MLEKEILNLPCALYAKHASLYADTNQRPKACILYFHGGGLLYGKRDDLTRFHLNRLTKAGYAIIAYDYPLAPAAGLETILEDVRASVRHYIDNSADYFAAPLPFFLWGRSAGAYLALMAAADGALRAAPKGILSYYGYGFLCDHWFQAPSPYYASLPAVDHACLQKIPSGIHAAGNLDTCYSIYVYARQNGCWRDLLYQGRDKFFYLNYTLRACGALPCPLFCAHSTNDPDVPYEEFLELSTRFKGKKFIVPGNLHDFDRDKDSEATQRLLTETVAFLDRQMERNGEK